LLTNAGRFNEYFGVDFDGLKKLIALVLLTDHLRLCFYPNFRATG
jgi:hypothetical protein